MPHLTRHARRSERRSQPGFAAAVLGWLVLGSCGGERQVAGPEEGNGTPDVAHLVVTVQADDPDLAAALGWEAGVPGAELQLLRNGGNMWRSATTDAAGVAEFPNVLPGLHRLYAGRTLSQAEADAAGQPIRAFGDGRTVEIDQVGDVSLTLHVVADHPGTLVIGEISGWSPPPEETGGSYEEAEYFEVYNNSDQVVHLDGKLFGATLVANESIPIPCTDHQGIRDDAGGVLARQAVAFPGTGSSYPVEPGEVKLVAVSAIDHSPVHPELFDLSHADFELRGVASADNPAVPDMLDVGLEPFVATLGNSSVTPLDPGRKAFFVAEPLDPQTLPIAYRDPNGRGWVQIPRESLIDVVGLSIIWPDSDRQFPPCVPMVHPDFDRYEGGFMEIGLGVERGKVSWHRRILRNAGGRAILQDANTSAVDIVIAPLSPGTVAP